jgi:hypothetical protein
MSSKVHQFEAPKMKTLLAVLALVPVTIAAGAAEKSHVDLEMECRSLGVPDDQLAACVSDLRTCSQNKPLAQCESEMSSADQ